MPRAQWSGNEAILYLDYITWNKANKDLKKIFIKVVYEITLKTIALILFK